jgi:hypothetical protein
VAGLSVEPDTDDPSSLSVEWWVDPGLPGEMEFLPQVCPALTSDKSDNSGCFNSTKGWSRERSAVISAVNNSVLHPYTLYNVTVFVRQGETVFPPALYKTVTTLEARKSIGCDLNYRLGAKIQFIIAAPSVPYDVKVVQEVADELVVSWAVPTMPNGRLTGYSVSFSPPNPPARLQVVPSSGGGGQRERVVLSNKESVAVFTSGVEYSFWVTARNGAGESGRSEATRYVYQKEVGRLSELKVKGEETFVTHFEALILRTMVFCNCRSE